MTAPLLATRYVNLAAQDEVAGFYLDGRVVGSMQGELSRGAWGTAQVAAVTSNDGVTWFPMEVQDPAPALTAPGKTGRLELQEGAWLGGKVTVADPAAGSARLKFYGVAETES